MPGLASVRMSYRALFIILVVCAFQASCSIRATGIGKFVCNNEKRLKLARFGMEDVRQADFLPFQEDLLIDGEPLNYYFGVMILKYFPEKHEQKIIVDILRAYKIHILTPDEVKRKCRGFLNPSKRKLCQEVAKKYHSKSKPCFINEQTYRKNLEEWDIVIVNKGSHATDLLHMLNKIRGGRMKDVQELDYYVKRFELYLRIYKRLPGWRVLLDTAIASIYKGWHLRYVRKMLNQHYALC